MSVSEASSMKAHTVTSKRTFGRARVAAMIAAASLLLPISPAWGAGSGVTTNGASNVNQTGSPTDVPPCLKAAANLKIDLWNKGTFNNSTQPFDTVAAFSSSDSYYFSPAGTFSDPLCTMPKAVLGKLTVTGGVGCTQVSATYRRVNTDYVIQTTQATTCTIAGTTNSETSNLKFTGEQIACVGPVDPCDPQGTSSDDSDNVEFTG
ncbi:MAG: hypothetical protein M3198_19200, partial [Actinomycetota bacterium]|nr:hypothetical protein [Actinomycetota bacterium]